MAATVERRLRPVSPERLSRLRARARATTLRADGVLAVFLTERPDNLEEVAIWEQASVFAHTRWYGAEMLARQTVAPPPPEAAALADELLDARRSSTMSIPPSPPRSPAASHRRRCATPMDLERLDERSRELAANFPADDPWAARGVVDILRTRALIAEITISLIGLRDAVSGLWDPTAEPSLP